MEDLSDVVRFLVQRRPLLFSVARRYESPRYEAEDLVADTELRMLERWKSGVGPETFTNAYMLRVMKNLAIDHQRSPRSRENSVAEPELVLPEGRRAAEEDPAIRAIDLGAEFDLVRRAFEGIVPSHRWILERTIVEGLGPSEIAAETGSTPSAVAARSMRARKALAKEALRLTLVEGGDECTRFAAEIASNPRKLSGAARAHIESCDECAEALRRFRGLPRLLGLLPFAGVTGALGAATVVSDEDAARAEEGLHGKAPRERRNRRRSSRSRRARRTGVEGIPFSLRVTTALAVAIFGIAALGWGTSSPSPRASGERTAAPSGDASAGSGQSSGLAIGPLQLYARVVPGEGTAIIEYGISGAEDGPRVESVRLDLPEGTRLEPVPDGWMCERNVSGGQTCAGAGSGGGRLGVAPDTDAVGGPFRLTVIAEHGQLRFTAVADGTIGFSW